MGKVVHRLVHGVFFEFRLFGGESLRGRLVGTVGAQPELMPQPGFVVVERAHIDHAFSRAVVAILFVVAHAHHDAQHADSRSQGSAHRAESRFGHVLIDVHQPVVDVVGRLHVRKLELALRALHLRQHGAQHRIVSRGRSSSGLKNARRSRAAMRPAEASLCTEPDHCCPPAG